MPKLRIEDRLPLALFSNVPFIYAGPDLMSLPLGMISSLMNYEGQNIQRFHPKTVSKAFGKSSLNDQMFCFSFFYIDNEGELALFLTHPYWFDRSDFDRCLDFYLKKIEEIARSHHCKRINLEFHDIIDSFISFPNSLSDFSYDLIDMKMNSHDIRDLKQKGFIEKDTILCYEQNVKETKKKIKPRLGYKNYNINSIGQSEFLKLKTDMDFEAKSYSLSNRDLIFSQRFIPAFKDAILIALNRSRPSGASNFEGFIRWSPDFLELAKRYRSPVPYLYPSILKDRVKYGKIFSWAIKEENAELFLHLLSRAASSMMQMGVENCQIAFLDAEQKFLKKVLEECGFKKIHEMKILEKRVN